MKVVSLLACVASVLTLSASTAVAVPQAKGPVSAPSKVEAPPPVCQQSLFGKGMFNGTFCQPVIDLYEKKLETNPCSEGCVLVPSKERGQKQLPKGTLLKVGDPCDWAMYDCRPTLPKAKDPERPTGGPVVAR